MPSAVTLAQLRDVLAQFGVTPDAIHDIRSGRVNKHWRILAGGNAFALRRYTPRRDLPAIEYEHELLAYLAAKQWPVAAPLPARDGRTAIGLSGQTYSLFPFLPGHPAPYENLRYVQIKGRLLAHLHAAMAAWRTADQRHGFGRVWDLDAEELTGALGTFEELLSSLRHGHPRLASEIQALRETSRGELSRAGYADLPDRPVHLDFHHDNILFQRGKLTALLDFDSARLDALVVDIAASIAFDCVGPPHYLAIDPAAVRAFISGYVTERRLSENEQHLIVPLVRAYLLLGMVEPVSQLAESRHREALPSIERTLRERLPNLERRTPAIQAAVANAAPPASVARHTSTPQHR